MRHGIDEEKNQKHSNDTLSGNGIKSNQRGLSLLLPEVADTSATSDFDGVKI